MNKNHLLLSLLLLLAPAMGAQEVVIDHPVYQVNSSGIREIEKIVLTNQVTEVYMNTPFLADWWITFNEETYIEDAETLEKFKLESILGVEIGEKVTMPASGDSTFVLLFPPLSKSVKTINYYEGDHTAIYELSLDPKSKKKELSEIPIEIELWMKGELAKAQRKQLIAIDNPNEFFSAEESRIIGYIKGYDARLGFSTGLLLENSTIEQNQLSHLVTISEDGRFEATLSPHHPSYNVFLEINNFYLPNLYIEPGQTLAVVLNWEEFRLASRLRDRKYIFKDLQFMGPLAQINQELLQFTPKVQSIYTVVEDTLVYKEVERGYQPLLKPMDFYHYLMNKLKEVDVEQSKAIAALDAGPQTKQLMKQTLKVATANTLLEYLHKHRVKEPDYEVEDVYYSFLQEIPRNEYSYLLCTGFDSFTNHLKFSATPFTEANEARLRAQMPTLSFQDYLFKQLALTPSTEDKEYVEFIKPYSQYGVLIDLESLKNDTVQLNKVIEKIAAFHDKYKNYTEEYVKNCFPEFTGFMELNTMNASYESTLNRLAGYDNQLITGLIALIQYTSNFEEITSDQSLECIDYITAKLPYKYIKSYLKSKHESLFNATPELEVDFKAMKDFAEILTLYRGKYIVVDVWGSWCGPCLASITATQSVRSRYANHPEFAFVFVSNEKESSKYRDYVQSKEMIYNHILEKDEYNRFCNQFKISGIPRYLFFDKEGQIINANFEINNLVTELEKLSILPN